MDSRQWGIFRPKRAFDAVIHTQEGAETRATKRCLVLIRCSAIFMWLAQHLTSPASRLVHAKGASHTAVLRVYLWFSESPSLTWRALYLALNLTCKEKNAQLTRVNPIMRWTINSMAYRPVTKNTMVDIGKAWPNNGWYWQNSTIQGLISEKKTWRYNGWYSLTRVTFRL